MEVAWDRSQRGVALIRVWEGHCCVCGLNAWVSLIPPASWRRGPMPGA